MMTAAQSENHPSEAASLRLGSAVQPPEAGCGGGNRRSRRRSKWLLALCAVIFGSGTAGSWLWNQVRVYPFAYEEEPHFWVDARFLRWGPHQHQPHGAYTRYYWPGGPVESSGRYRLGQPHGWWRFYSESGMLLYERKCDKGRCVAERRR
jgi:hypothetical protein